MSSDAERIPSFKVDFTPEEIAAGVAAFDDILRSGRLTLGPYTRAFESAFASACEVATAVAVSSGDAALEIIFRCLGVSGREVLVPVNTNFATAAAALGAGGKVVFYDSGLYPVAESIESLISSRTAAVVVVHIGGYVWPPVTALARRCEELGAALVEDAAHAHGARVGASRVGSIGHAAAFSFFPTKVVTTMEGGMITTSNIDLAGSARRYRDQGKDPSTDLHVVMGGSWRMTEIGAALGSVQLLSLAEDTRFRNEIIAQYAAELADIDAIKVVSPEVGTTASGYKCVALLRSEGARQRLPAALQRAGIDLGRGVYDRPLHRHPVFAPLVSSTFPSADRFASRHVCLPLWRRMTTRQASCVSDAIRRTLSSWE